MRSDPTSHAAVARPRTGDGGAFDVGLADPVAVGSDEAAGDERLLAALLDVELALTRALAASRPEAAAALPAVESAVRAGSSDAADLALAARAGGNPVIPLVKRLRAAVRESAPDAAAWVHRGATSQDVVDSATALVAVRAGTVVLDRLDAVIASLGRLAAAHADDVCVGRTLTQHATPTTFGAKAAVWTRAVVAAARRLETALDELPAQLGGASGTLASLVAQVGADETAELPTRLAAELGLASPAAPWHVDRTPITVLGDALAGVLDALGAFATNVATLARPELAEVVEADGGGSSAMPQKRNPVRSVLVRSAAMRAPSLAADLHRAAALTVDERPDGAWHAEWQPLRELLRLALGASALAAELASGLRVDADRMRATLVEAGPLILAERVSLELSPRIGAERVQALVDDAVAGGDLEASLRAEPGLEDVDVPALLDPAGYVGLAPRFAREAAALARAWAADHPSEQEAGQ